MANSLLITKLSDGSFSFVVNGDTLNTIINLRNDMTSIGNEIHIKTSEGANLIKLQQILYNEVTIISGSTLPVASSPLDLRVKLRSVGFWDWMAEGGGGSSNRFDSLLDTFQYFGNNGKVPMVDEAQLRLYAYSLPDTSYLNLFPTPLIALKGLRVNVLASAYEFYDIVNTVTQFIRSGYTETSPSEDVINSALALKANISDLPGSASPIEIYATAGQTVFNIGTTRNIVMVFYNGAPLVRTTPDWQQTGSNITTTFPANLNDLFQFI